VTSLADLDPADTVFLDPPTRVNFNVPNFALAFASADTGIPVVDQHILAFPPVRVLHTKPRRARKVIISLRPHTLAAAARTAASLRRQGREVSCLRGPVDVQCCYPFLTRGPVVEHSREFSDSLPIPQYELFDSFNYMSTNWSAGLWPYPLLTSVGCPYGCTFCEARQRRWRTRSPEHCVAELEQAVHKYQVRSFEIMDDVFNLDTERLERFCALASPLKLRWSCANGLRADRFDEEQARALSRAGCNHVGFGVESTDPEVLLAIRKGETVAQLQRAVRVAREYFDVVFAYFIIGLPGSTYDSDLASLRWAEESGVVPNHSYYVDDRQGSSEAFFGSGARPSSAAYAGRLQQQIYRRSRALKKKAYTRQNLVGGALKATLRAAPGYNLNSLLSHLILSTGQVITLLRSGELQ